MTAQTAAGKLADQAEGLTPAHKAADSYRKKIDNYLDCTGLLSQGMEPEEARELLRFSYLTGHDGRPIVDAELVEVCS